MALRLTSTTRIDPRYDGHRTTFGSAFSHFLKIRTERNLIIWKQRLKDANPLTLMKMENEIQDRIYKLHSLQRDMQKSDISLKQKLLFEQMRQRRDSWEIAVVDRFKRDEAQAELIKATMEATAIWTKYGVPDGATAVLQAGKRTMDTGTVSQWFANMVANDAGALAGTPGVLGVSTSAVMIKWNDVLRAGSIIALQEGGTTSNEKYYVDAYKMAKDFGQAYLDADPNRQQTEDHVMQLRQLLVNQTNRTRYGSDTNQDILNEAGRREDVQKEASAGAKEILQKSAGMYGGGKIDLGEIEEFTGGGKVQESIQKSIDLLTTRLAGLATDREGAAAEYQYLLRGGGIHMGLDPVSFRPSRASSRMDAYRRMYAADPNLAETEGRTGAVTFSKGTGGNLSDFLKKRIGQYQDAVDDQDANFKLMNDITAAVKSYGIDLADKDVAFDTKVKPMDTEVGGLKTLVADWESTIAANPTNPKVLAKIYLAELADSPSNLTRNYAALAKTDKVEANKRVWEHNARVYPARTNVSVILNPRIDRILNARDEGNREEMYNGMTDLYKFVSQPGIDDLLGSAGTNIRGILEDMQTSAEEIGAENALERTARQIQNQQVGLAEQRRDQDPGELLLEGE